MSKLPRWRGFNLDNRFHQDYANRPFRREDFDQIAEWGFDFIRFPMDYRIWTDKGDWTRLLEPELKKIDEAIDWAARNKLHAQLNFHRAPGYTVNVPPEAKSLWRDEDAVNVCCLHWAAFAKRYKGRPNLSFNPLNEPANVGAEPHKKAMTRIVEAIRKEDDKRLIICDGRDYGAVPAEELLSLNVAHSTRGYQPFQLTHYLAEWVAVAKNFPKPERFEPRQADEIWDRYYRPWIEFEKKGVGVMVGEFGCYNKTPHAVVLSWMEEMLKRWKTAGWGWALWNYRGTFGILDSARSDVQYRDYKGQKLDQAMLNLLRQH